MHAGHGGVGPFPDHGEVTPSTFVYIIITSPGRKVPFFVLFLRLGLLSSQTKRFPESTSVSRILCCTTIGDPSHWSPSLHLVRPSSTERGQLWTVNSCTQKILRLPRGAAPWHFNG